MSYIYHEVVYQLPQIINHIIQARYKYKLTLKKQK